MIELSQLEQLLRVSKSGTFIKAADELHMSQPALSRSMQRLEAELAVTLFERHKNKIELNQNGKLVVECAENVVSQIYDMVNRVQALDRSRSAIVVGACAPSPLWDIVPLLSSLYCEKPIFSEIRDYGTLMHGLYNGTYQIAVVPNAVDEPGVHCAKYGEERLYFALSRDHALSGAKELHFSDLDGETMIQPHNIGIWDELHKKKMPSSQFVAQEDAIILYELLRTTSVSSCLSDTAIRRLGYPHGRVVISIADEEACMTYYCLSLADNKKNMEEFYEEIGKREQRSFAQVF